MYHIIKMSKFKKIIMSKFKKPTTLIAHNNFIEIKDHNGIEIKFLTKL